MNEVFLIGKIISDIEFKFIINSKNKAIACFEIKTADKQIVRIQAYNQLADFTYSKLNENDKVLVLQTCLFGKYKGKLMVVAARLVEE